jgi:hypothetical protein
MMKMNIVKLEGNHLTATNKRHIAEMLTKGITEGGTKALHYVFSEIDGCFARLSITKKEKNDWGKTVYRKGNYRVLFNNPLEV